jgi:signal transduction histidine kinase
MNIHSIPPLLSAIVLLALFLMGIFSARKSQMSFLFSLICLMGCLLNIDKTILTVTLDPAFALRVSRTDHLFLVFVIPVYLHFVVVATGRKRWMLPVKALYGAAILLMPVTQLPLYLTSVKAHYFGYFAIAGPLFNLFGLFTVSVACSLYLLITGLRTEKVSVKRTRIKYILLGFGLAAFLNHFDFLAMQGYEAYPLGNFIFIPLSLLGYAIYRHDVMEWRIFLNKGIVFLTLLLTSTGFFIGLTVVIRNLFSASLHSEVVYVTSMVLTFLFFYVTRERVQNFLSQFIQQQFIRNRRAIRDLSFEILTLHDSSKIRRTIIKKMSELFQLKRCDIRPVPRTDGQEEPRLIGENEELWAQGFRFSIPVSSASQPSRLLLGEKGDMSLFTGEEGELLAILGNHTALALDNATAYSKIRDFSDSLEKIVDERTKALIQSESLAAVGRLAAGVAHELNNPIASVMSTLEYQVDHLDQDEELREDMAFALGELRRVRDIVRSLLDASRQKEETKEGVDIHRPIEDALRILHSQYKNRRITMETGLDAPHSMVRGNQSRLCQVYINLIKNAIDAIGEKEGRIRIETTNELVEEAGMQRVISRITDSGEGIEKKILKNIFNPFFTTKQQGKGIGLGLYIVHEIVKDHEGKVTVESTVGQGTTVTISFPCPPQ